MQRNAHYPYHLAKLVAAQLRALSRPTPPETVLTRLFETLYFASLKTDEGRPVLCTVNYADPAEMSAGAPEGAPADRWQHVPFERPLPLDVRTLTKLARAADPAISSINVFSDRNNKLYLWGLADQELRYSDFVALDAAEAPQRPGLFQVRLAGVGNLAVSVNYALIGSLEQNTLVQEYHDVLWSGPVHGILQSHLRSFLADECEQAAGCAHLEGELLVRWINALCRLLMNIQRYRHGGGLLIVPSDSPAGLNIKYRVYYDRLPRALVGIVEHEFARYRLAAEIEARCADRERDQLPAALHFELRKFRRKFDEHKNAVLGCAHFVAGLSCVDGFVLMDRKLAVRGFGAETRTVYGLNEIFVAGDCDGSAPFLRVGELSQYGTRHRAMMRYCFENAGALGFVVSQDGDVRAMTRVGERLVLWENIEVQLALKTENVFAALRRAAAHAAEARVA